MPTMEKDDDLPLSPRIGVPYTEEQLKRIVATERYSPEWTEAMLDGHLSDYARMNLAELEGYSEDDRRIAGLINEAKRRIDAMWGDQ